MIDWINPTTIQLLGLTLLHFIWQGLIVGLMYAASLFMLKPGRASSRYNLAVATLVVLALLPPLTFAWLKRVTTGLAEPVAGGAEFIAMLVETSQASLGLSPLAWVVALWLAGVLLLSVRLLLGWHYLLKLRRTADHLAARTLQPALARLKARFGIRRSVALALSERIHSPVVVGWLRPLILLPPALMARLPMAQIEMVLAHELAHIRRHDHLVNLFQTVVETLLFYHPVVAWVSRRIRIERENACDDLAVAATENRLAYVEMLASLEHLRRVPTRFALGVQDGQVLGRIRRLVEPGYPGGQRGLSLPAVLVVTLLAGAAGLQWLPDRAEPDMAIESAAETTAEIEPTRSSAIPRIATSDSQAEPESTRELANAEPPRPLADESPEPVSATPSVDLAAAQPALPVERSQAVASGPVHIESNRMPRGEAGPEPQIEPEPIEPAARPDALQLAMLSRPEPRPSPLEQPTEPEPVIEVTPTPITGGSVINRVEPEFPPRARLRRADGLVELEFLVDERGRVSEIEVLSEQPTNLAFGRAAEKAVAQWQFEPFRQGQQLISRRVRLEVEFSPSEGCAELLGSRIPRC